MRLGEGLTPRSSSVMLVRRLMASASGSAKKDVRLRSKTEEPETEVAEGDAGRAGGGRPRREEEDACIFI